nr:hypothetical protein [Tanacetum cinerariifolium]
MLLRSASNPALNSWSRHENHKDLLPFDPLFIRRNSISLHSLSDLPKTITRASSESNLHIWSPITKNGTSTNSTTTCLLSSIAVEEETENEEYSDNEALMFSTSGLYDKFGLEVDDGYGCGGGGGEGKISGGGGNGNDHDDDGDNTDVYYRSMIEANPGNSMLLSNYAKYLKEVQGDFVKAEEYCSRAILMNPGDGNVLSMYADLIWETQKDASRAQSYHDQAVQASPDDCYVMASYARFLWDADDDDDDEEEEDEVDHKRDDCGMNVFTPSYLTGTSQPPPIAAAS